MSTRTSYYVGGYKPAAAAQNKSEQWSNATSPGDPTPAGYLSWDVSGNITATRPLTSDESAQLAAQDASAAVSGNQSTIQQQAQTALAVNRTYLAIGSPSAAQVAAQVRALTMENTALIRLALGQFDGTS